MRNPLKSLWRFGERRAVQIASFWWGALGFSSPAARHVSRYWEIFKTNEIVHAAIMESARAEAGVPFLLEAWEDGRWRRLPDTHFVLRRLESPNPDQDGVAFREAVTTELLVTGNAIVVELRTRVGLGELRLLPTRSVWVERDSSTGSITAYWHDPQRTGALGPEITTINRPSSAAVRYEASQVIHRRYVPDPAMPDWGLSPLSACVDSVDADFSITAYITNFFKYGAVPPYLLTTTARLTEEQRLALESYWQRRMGGVENAWKLAVIDGTQASLQRLGLAAGSREVGLFDLRKSVEARILSVLNVPPIVVGAVVGLENMTYSNYAQARQAMYEENTEPLLRRRDAAWTHYLARRFPGQMLRVRADLSGVLAVQEREAQRSERVRAELLAAAITQNEARQELGRPPLQDGDVVLWPVNMQLVPAALAEGAAPPIFPRLVAKLADALGDDEAVAEVLGMQAELSALALGTAPLPIPQLVRDVFQSIPPRGPDEAKREFAVRLLRQVHILTQQSKGGYTGDGVAGN